MVDIFMNGLFIVVFWYAALYTANTKRVDRINKLQEENGIFYTLYNISWVVICFLIVVDLGLVIFPDLLFFYALGEILSLSIFSRIIGLMILFVVFESTIRISRTVLRSEKYIIQSRIDGVSFANGLVAIGISGIVLFVQNVLFGEMYVLYRSTSINLVFEIILSGIFFLTPAVILIVNGLKYIRYESVSRQARHLIFPLSVFIGFGYIVVVYAISFYNLFLIIKKKIYGLLNKNNTNDYEDLLLLGTTMNKGNIIGKINTYFLLSSFLIMLITIYMGSSPYPIVTSIYKNTQGIVLFQCAAVLSYFIFEQISSASKGVLRNFRAGFIPTFIILIILPFLLGYGEKSSYLDTHYGISLYHNMMTASEGSSALFFICVIGLVIAIGFSLHIFTGEIDKEKHAVTLIPIVGWLQFLLFCIIYPIMVTRPPYYFVENRRTILILLGIALVLLVFVVGQVSHFIFNSQQSKIALYVHDFWKSRIRIYVVVSIITLGLIAPMLVEVFVPIYNTNTDFLASYDYFDGDAYALLETVSRNQGTEAILILESKTDRSIQIIHLDTLEGTVIAEDKLQITIEDYVIWGTNKVVFIKSDHQGFVLYNMATHFIEMEETISNPEDYEYLEFAYSSGALLVTKGLEQYLIDKNIGEYQLTTIGNNFYKLIPGEVTCLWKNGTLHRLIDGYITDTLQPYKWGSNDYFYVLDNGFIEISEGVITFYNNEFSQEDPVVFELESIMMADDELIFDHQDDFFIVTGQTAQESQALVLSKSQPLQSNLIKLVQKVYTNKDLQQLIMLEDVDHYMLYDENQITVYDQGEIQARQWTQGEEIEENAKLMGSPVVNSPFFFWFSNQGNGYKMQIIGDEDGDY